MQSKEIIQTNTRSFQEIWKTLSPSERDDISIKLYQKKCCTTRQSIHNWANGLRRPSPLAQEAIAAVVSRAIGAKCFPKTLFPA